MKVNRYGFYLNGEQLLKTVVATSLKGATDKLNFFYPVNFNIQIKLIETIEI